MSLQSERATLEATDSPENEPGGAGVDLSQTRAGEPVGADEIPSERQAFLTAFFAPDRRAEVPTPSLLRRWNLVLSPQHQTRLATGLLAVALLFPAIFMAYSVRSGGLRDIDTASPLTAQFQLDINEAAWFELVNLPGVGPSLAAAIVDYRERFGRFESVESLRAVPGIGEKKLDSIRAFLGPVTDELAE